ncbi:hypothetical protein CSUI_003601, partial [Cystoisospora suis]
RHSLSPGPAPAVAYGRSPPRGPYGGPHPPSPGPYGGPHPPSPGPYGGPHPPSPGPYRGPHPPSPGPYGGAHHPSPGPYGEPYPPSPRPHGEPHPPSRGRGGPYPPFPGREGPCPPSPGRYGGPHRPSPARPPPHAGLSPPESRHFSWEGQRHRGRPRAAPHQFGMQTSAAHPPHTAPPSGCRPSSAAPSSGRTLHHSHSAHRGFRNSSCGQEGPGMHPSEARPCCGSRAERGLESRGHPGACRSHSTGPSPRGAIPSPQFTQRHPSSCWQAETAGPSRTYSRSRPDARDRPFLHAGSASRSPSTGRHPRPGAHRPPGHSLPHTYGSLPLVSRRAVSPPPSAGPFRHGGRCPPSRPTGSSVGTARAWRQKSTDRFPLRDERDTAYSPGYGQARGPCSARYPERRPRRHGSGPLPDFAAVRAPEGVVYPETANMDGEHLSHRRVYYHEDQNSVRTRSNGSAYHSLAPHQERPRNSQSFFPQAFRECCEAQSIEAPRVDRQEGGQTHFHFYQPKTPPPSSPGLAAQSAVVPQHHFNFYASPAAERYMPNGLAGSDTVATAAQVLGSGYNPVVSSLLQENMYYQQLIAEQQQQIGAMAAAQQVPAHWLPEFLVNIAGFAD